MEDHISTSEMQVLWGEPEQLKISFVWGGSLAKFQTMLKITCITLMITMISCECCFYGGGGGGGGGGLMDFFDAEHEEYGR